MTAIERAYSSSQHLLIEKLSGGVSLDAGGIIQGLDMKQVNKVADQYLSDLFKGCIQIVTDPENQEKILNLDQELNDNNNNNQINDLDPN